MQGSDSAGSRTGVSAAPTVSVVIIGRNEGERLTQCINSVRTVEQDFSGIEVIYVDSGSSDESVAAAALAGARVLMVDSARPTAALGRNQGWEAARGEFVLFLDGDTILHPDFLRRALDAISAEPMIAAVWGHRREIHCEQSVYNRVLDLDWVYAPGFTEYCGGDVLMRRQALAEVGGYDAALIAGEEPELCRRLRAKGYRILHIDAPMTGHDLAMFHFSQYWKRALRAGHAYAEVSARFRDTPDQFWSPQRRQNFVRGGFWFLTLILALICCIPLRSFLPAAIWILLLVILAARTAWLARWKSTSPSTLFLYGVHSHLQQIPILVGQLQFASDVKSGARRKLIEYKSK